ncbi:MAG: gluconokinase [Saprospiraceae bacterium]
MENVPHILLMGVSGSGKSTVGKLLAAQLDIAYLEGDDYHTAKNVVKMSQRMALTDKDRWPWLIHLSTAALMHSKHGFVMACSALKASYRDFLRERIGLDLTIVFLNGTYAIIEKRIKKRSDHYMSSDLLADQFNTLEIPKNVLFIDITDTPENIVRQIIQNL